MNSSWLVAFHWNQLKMGTRMEVLSLYRNIMKLHKKKLPADFRQLGDDYVRNEWKLHKKASPGNFNYILCNLNLFYGLIYLKKRKIIRFFYICRIYEKIS